MPSSPRDFGYKITLQYEKGLAKYVILGEHSESKDLRTDQNANLIESAVDPSTRFQNLRFFTRSG